MNLITIENVRELLESGDEDPTLVVIEGTATVVPGATVRQGDYEGQVVASRDDLAALTPTDLTQASDAQLEELAARLDAAISNQGA